MVKFEIQGLNGLEITEAMESYFEKKLNRACKHNEQLISSVKTNLSYEAKTDSNIVEIIVFLGGGKTIRNYSRTDDMYASIDIACASIERQLRKAKEKIIDVRRYRSFEEKFAVADKEKLVA